MLLGRRDENKRTLLYTCDCFFKAARFKRDVYSRVIVFLELKAKRRLRYNLNACGFLLSSSGEEEREKHTLFYLLLAQLILQFSEICPTELIWIL